MPSPTDPIRTIERRKRLTWLSGLVLLTTAAIAAFMPGRRASVLVPELRGPSSLEGARDEIISLDPHAFTALLWNPPPPPPSPPQPAPKDDEVRIADRRPFMLQLIGIIEEEGQPRRAVLYDPQADKLLIVADGESIEPYRVLRITNTMIELSDGRATRRLELLQGKGSS